MGRLLRDRNHHTYGDYLSWDEDSRYELIDGHAYLMTLAPSVDHQKVAGGIFFQIRRQLEGKPCRPFIAPLDVQQPKAEEANEPIDTVLQPDILVVCDESKIDQRGVRGAPDWVVEVISPSSATHDQIHKHRVYEQHGVRELWLVHPNDRLLSSYRLVDGEYGKPELQELAGATPVGILPGLAIQWEELLDKLSNPANY